MRRLMLLRHAKSDWPPGVADLERPLAARGRAEAPAIGGFMAREALRPDLALVSPAKRTRETWTLVSTALPEPPPHEIEADLYMTTAERLIERVRATAAGVQTLLVLGHNPGLEDLARTLAGKGDAAAKKRLMASFPTSGLAVIDFPSDDWTDVQEQAGTLALYVTPQSLGAKYA